MKYNISDVYKEFKHASPERLYALINHAKPQRKHPKLLNELK